MSKAAPLLKSVKSIAGGALRLTLSFAVFSALLAVAAAWLLAHIITASVFQGADLAHLTPHLLLLFALWCLKAVFIWAGEQAGFAAARRVRRHFFHLMLDHISQLGPYRLSDLPTGALVASLTDALSGIEPYWRRWLPAKTVVSVLPLVILAIIAPQDGWAFLILLLTLPLLPIFMMLAGKGAQAAGQRQWQSLTRLGGHLLDAVQGLADLKRLGAAKREVAVVGEMAQAYRRDTMSVLRLAFLTSLILEFFSTVSIALIAVTIGFRLLSGTMSFQHGFFILLLAPEFYAPLRNMGVQRHAKMEAEAAAERLLSVLDRPLPTRQTAPTAERQKLAPCTAVNLRLQGVHVHYSGDRHALKGIDLTLKAGEHIALVGESGAGKSTLLAVLMGFVEPSNGLITINDLPLMALDMTEWRRHIAYMPQRPHLFDASVDENISMGRVHPFLSENAAIEAALTAANAQEFVAHLPQGRQTILQERGQGLSGGQAQRLMLARAFFLPAPLVLFDEPTAHLDQQTEDSVSAAIQTLSQGRTKITIAHRLSTIRNADRILVLADGAILEQGTHADLLAQKGAYARLYQMQQDDTL